MTRTKDAVLQDLAREEQRLVELERTGEGARAKIEALRSELVVASASTSVAQPPPPRLPLVTSDATPRTAADKVRLFRSLFRGRTDVFPIRFVSKKTGKPGYAPACS